MTLPAQIAVGNHSNDGEITDLQAAVQAFLDSRPISVKEFGAKGDGKTDDTDALQKALKQGGSILLPIGVYVFSSTLTTPANFSTLAGMGPGSILRFNGNLPSGDALQIGFQSSHLFGLTVRDFQLDKTSSATVQTLMHVRGIETSYFENLHLSNAAANTGATQDNIVFEDGFVNTWINIYSKRAGRYGIRFQALSNFTTDAANDNILIGCDFEDNVSAGVYIINSEHMVLYGCTFQDFGVQGQHGVLLDDRAQFTVIRDCYFEAQGSASNDIRIAPTAHHADFCTISGNTHRGGPTVDLFLDSCSNIRVWGESSVNIGTFATVTSNTDRAWFLGNVCGSSTTYVADSGTNTIIWGDKSGSPSLNVLRMLNGAQFQSFDSSGNVRRIAWLQSSGAMNFGDPSQPTFMDGTSFNLNCPFGGVLFASLGTPLDGTVYFCPDATSPSNPATGGGTGALVVRQNSTWKAL